MGFALAGCGGCAVGRLGMSVIVGAMGMLMLGSVGLQIELAE